MHAKELIRLTDALFESPGPSETFEERRLRHAACLLSDMAWRGHPDYRGEQSAVLVAQSAIVGVDHPGRAFLALCVYHRYERRLTGELLPKLCELIPRQERKRALSWARRCGSLIRFRRAWPEFCRKASSCMKTGSLFCAFRGNCRRSMASL